MAKINGFPDPGNDFLVNLSLSGLAKTDRGLDARLPITIKILRKLLSTIDTAVNPSYDQALYTAMWSLAFFAFLRIGEFTVRQSSDMPIISIHSVHLAHYLFSPAMCRFRSSDPDHWDKATCSPSMRTGSFSVVTRWSRLLSNTDLVLKKSILGHLYTQVPASHAQVWIMTSCWPCLSTFLKEIAHKALSFSDESECLCVVNFSE